MLAALNVVALGLGVAGGGLTATVVSLGLGGVFNAFDVPNGAQLGLFLGIFVGLLAGGWLSGRMAVHSHRFHGSVTGLVLAGMVVLLASAGAADVSILAILTMAFLSIAVGGVGGWLGGRNRPAPT